ncbi:N-formylglutamate amidohydrolase [Rhodovibrionaceae bacterium A322]
MTEALLSASEAPSYAVERPEGQSPVFLVCEHASASIPAALNGLGLSDETRLSHAAWDIGALGLAQRLSHQLDACLVHQRYSRLVYDCNRPPESAGAMPAKSEVHAIPGNEALTDEQRSARVEEIYRPFVRKVSDLLDARLARGLPTVFVTIHSFTPVFHGHQRETELGVLFGKDRRLGEAILAAAQGQTAFSCAANYPYSAADGVLHTLDLQAGARHLPNVMLEIRNDGLLDEAGQGLWASRLAELIQTALPQLPQSHDGNGNYATASLDNARFGDRSAKASGQ